MFCDIRNSLHFFGIVGCQAEARKCKEEEVEAGGERQLIDAPPHLARVYAGQYNAH